MIKKLGEGSFGQISLVEIEIDGKIEQYAMKKISQNQLFKV